MTNPQPRWRPDRPYNRLPALPPAVELVDVIFEQPYCRIGNLVDKGIAQRQTASRYLHDLTALGVLREMPFGKEKLFIHSKLMELLGRDGNRFEPYS